MLRFSNILSHCKVFCFNITPTNLILLPTDNLDGLKARQRSEDEDRAKMNDKIRKLRAQLDEVFADRPDSKVIIFVQMRVVAQYMADLLNKLRPGVFKAKEFTSEGPSSEDAGIKKS